MCHQDMCLKACVSKVVSWDMCLKACVSKVVCQRLCLGGCDSRHVSKPVSHRLCLKTCVLKPVSHRLCLEACVSKPLSQRLCLETLHSRISRYIFKRIFVRYGFWRYKIFEVCFKLCFEAQILRYKFCTNLYLRIYISKLLYPQFLTDFYKQGIILKAWQCPLSNYLGIHEE